MAHGHEEKMGVQTECSKRREPMWYALSREPPILLFHITLGKSPQSVTRPGTHCALPVTWALMIPDSCEGRKFRLISQIPSQRHIGLRCSVFLLRADAPHRKVQLTR